MSADWWLGMIAGAAAGFPLGAHWAWSQWLKTPAPRDTLADGIRSQLSRVTLNRRMVGDLRVTSYATLTNSDGEFEIIVRQPPGEELP